MNKESYKSKDRWVKFVLLFCLFCFSPLNISAQENSNSRQAKQIFQRAYNHFFGKEGVAFTYKISILGIYHENGSAWYKGEMSKSIHGNTIQWNDGKLLYKLRTNKNIVEIHDPKVNKEDELLQKFKFYPDEFNYHISKQGNDYLVELKAKPDAKNTKMKHVKILLASGTYYPKELKIKILSLFWAKVTFADFKANYEVPQALIDAIVAEGEKQDVKPRDEAEKEKTLPYLRVQLKALIARDLWDMSEYFSVFNEQSAMVKKALEVLAGDDTFWLGADISGTSQLEANGVQLYNAQGEPRENKLALRAKAQGMAIMIDFHYSDWWADPGKQNIPKAWEKMSYEEMQKALAQHTRETLQLLKDNGIDVKWVQVGNETTHGFLWPMARAEEQMQHYAGLTQAGYDAVKEVYPQAICIVHLDAACDAKRYQFIFDGLKQYGAKWDMIGLSVYPYWDIDAKLTKDEDETLTKAIANINALYKTYQTPLMIVETGYDADHPEAGKKWLKRLISAARTQTDGHCKGVFYWAPEAEGHYRLGAFRNHRPTAIMDAFKD